MAWVIGDPRRGLDHLCHPGEGPQVCRVAVRPRSLLELALDRFELTGRQLRHPARTAGRGETARPARPPVGVPTAHALAGHLKLAGYLGLGLSFGEEPSCFPATLLESREVPSRPDAHRHSGRSPQHHEKDHGDSLSLGGGLVTVLGETL